MNTVFRHACSATVLLWLCLASGTRAAESIAQIRNLDLQLQQGAYQITLYSVATLSNIALHGLKVAELSGLAWDQDEGRLYALSDNGYFLELQPVFQGQHLQEVLLHGGHRLLDEKGKALRYRRADSEGIAIENGANGRRGDSQLLVSFEREPRLARYRTDGTLVTYLPLPAELDDIGNYRSENKALEAVTIHETLGILVGPEFSLKDTPAGLLNIYSLDGGHWSVPTHDEDSGALVDMAAPGDGSLIALERVYDGVFSGIQSTLHRIEFQDGGIRIAEQIYTFNPEDGLFNDDFEGLAHLAGNRYLMVSDDNNHPFKRTQLVYFEIVRQGGNTK